MCTHRSRKWPTIVIVEARCSETRQKLEQMFDSGPVKKALTLSVLVVRLTSRNGNIAKNQQFPFPSQKIEIIRNPTPAEN
ncbi:hypothetical protein N7465_005263 [Penicillium sp. CMV-2018d]|nr:hypothetical protein N7465_005263 [Penicillium sp. CMV-2018d]